MRTRLRLTILMFLMLVAPGTVHGRPWMLQDGTRIDGKFIRLEGNSVRLGVRREFKLYLFSRFSVTDQEWIRFRYVLSKSERDQRLEEINKRPERTWTLKNGQRGTGRFLRFFRAELANGAVVSHVTIFPIQSFPFRELVQKDQTYVEQVLVEFGLEELLESPDKEGRIPPKARDKEEENPRDRGKPPPRKYLPVPRVPGDRGKQRPNNGKDQFRGKGSPRSPKSESDRDLTRSDPEHDYSPRPGTTLERVPFDSPRVPRGDKSDDGERNQDSLEPSRSDSDRSRSDSDRSDRSRSDSDRSRSDSDRSRYDSDRSRSDSDRSRSDSDRSRYGSDRQSQQNSPSEETPENENSLKDDIMEGNYKDLPTRHGGQLALIIVIVVGALVLLKVLRG